MSTELDLLPVFTSAGLAAIEAAHKQGMAVKVSHIALGDTGAAIRDANGLPLPSARARTGLGSMKIRVPLTAGGDVSPTSVTMLAEVPAAKPEFWVREVGFYTDAGVLLAFWSASDTNLGWRGAQTPWVFRFTLAWTDLPPDAITIDYNGDAALNAWALDQARLKAKVRHTVEASGQNWSDIDETQLTRAVLPPAGMITFFAQNAPPPGWLKCNGAHISRTAYAALYRTIGTLYGAGNGSTTFNLPDLRGEFLRVWDDGRGVDPGRTLRSAQTGTHITADDNQYPAVHGAYISSEIGGDDPDGQERTLAWIGPPALIRTAGAWFWRMVRPRNVALLACIKY